MKPSYITAAALLFLSVPTFADETRTTRQSDIESIAWQNGMDIESLWTGYTAVKGGITWGKSERYPEYNKVKEGDTLWIQVEQGPCLMEFFHGRWRRANDVRRWHESVNDYGGCPYVFD